MLLRKEFTSIKLIYLQSKKGGGKAYYQVMKVHLLKDLMIEPLFYKF